MADRVVSYKFTGNFTNLAAGLTTMSRGVADAGRQLTALDGQGERSRRGLTQLGGTAGKVGLAAAAGLGAIVLAAANFDSAMSKVQAATGASADSLKELRDAAVKAGADTVFSATEAADAITAMSKAGIAAEDILSGGLDGALALASAGELDVAQAADIAATAMNQFGLAGADIPHIADLLAAGAASAQGEVTDFATALKYVGPVAHQMGISIEETTGVIAELASQGVLADQAGTSLRGMLTALTSPSKMAKTEMEKLGITLYDAQGQFIGFDGVAGQLHDTLGTLTNAERDQALGRIFGNEQITAARILYAGGTEAVEKWTNAVDKDGAAADIAGTKLDNLRGDLEALKGSLETALIGSGEGAQGPLRSLAQGATAATNAFNALPGSTKTALTGLLAITAVTGGALWFGSKVIGGIAATKAALVALGRTGVIVSGILKGMGTAIGGLVALYAVGAVVDGLQRKFDKALPGVEALTKALLDLDNAGTASALEEDIGNLGDALDAVDTDGLEGLSNQFLELKESGGALGATIKGLEAAGSLGQSLFRDDGKQLREAKASIEAVDEALSNLVASGGPDKARDVFEQLAEAQGLSADEQKDLLSMLPEYKEALDGAANSATLTGEATEGVVSADEALATAAGDAAQETADLVDAMTDQKDAAVAAFDAITGYRQAMKDAAKQAEKNNAGIKGDSKAQLANRDALSGLISGWNSLDATVTNNIGKFKEARDNFIKTAVAMGVPKKAAEDLWKEMAKIPESKVVGVETPGMDPAISKAKTLKEVLAQIKSKKIEIALHYQTIGNKPHPQTPGGDPGGEDPDPDDRHSRSRGLNVVPTTTGKLSKDAEAKSLLYLKQQSGDAGKAAKGLKERLQEAEQKLTRFSRKADDAAAALESLKSQRDELASSVSGSLSRDLFGGTLGEFQTENAAQTADAQAVLAALQTLVANGLDPHSDLFKRLAASGNVALIGEFAALTKDQLAGEAAQFAAGQGALAAVGSFAGESAFGDLIAAQAKVTANLDGTVQRLAQNVNHLEKAIDKMGDKVKNGAHDGAESGTTAAGERLLRELVGQVAAGHRRGK